MPYTTELTQDCLGIVHSGSGILTGSELVAGSVAAAALFQNTENFHYEFADFSDITDLQTEPDTLEKIVTIDRTAAKWRPRAIIIVVAPRDDSYEMARQWERQVQDLGWTIHISRERTEAVRWLGQHLKTERPELLTLAKKSAA